jgi:hypothetical protein
MTALPHGFTSFVTNIGIKDSSDDFTVVAADNVVAAAGVFTLSRFAGPSVLVSRKHIASHSARAVVVISKNANVATGEQGLANALEVVQGVAAKLGCDPHDVLIASTGVIGRQYPIEKVRTGLASLPFPLPNNDADSVARGIMTTDTVIAGLRQALMGVQYIRHLGRVILVHLAAEGFDVNLAHGLLLRAVEPGFFLWRQHNDAQDFAVAIEFIDDLRARPQLTVGNPAVGGVKNEAARREPVRFLVEQDHRQHLLGADFRALGIGGQRALCPRHIGGGQKSQ